MKRATILGAGMVGSAMALDLAGRQGFEVTIADVRQDALDAVAAVCPAKAVHVDLSNPAAVKEAVARADVVLGALPSGIGLQTLRAVIEAGKSCCDISFMAEDATQLDELARRAGVTVVFDCGVAPGMSNMMAGYGASSLDPCESIEIYVAGLPLVRLRPFEFKAGSSPADVIEAYTRPARIVEHGKVVVCEALSQPELLDFPGVGTLEAFNTDGLRSLAYTLKVPFMKAKTMRYPGHIALMRAFRDTGLFSKEPVEVGGKRVRPLDLTSRLLFPKWTYESGERDLTLMRVVADGIKDGQRTRYTWDLLDYHDPKTDVRSMSRTTAFPATIVASMIASGAFVRPGVHPPEVLGREPGLLDAVLAELAERGVSYSAGIDSVATPV